MKRGIALLTMLAVTAGALAGCGGGSADAPATGEQPAQTEGAESTEGTQTPASADGKRRSHSGIICRRTKKASLSMRQ